MLPNSVSYCRAKPFKVLAAAPRPREKGRFRVAIWVPQSELPRHEAVWYVVPSTFFFVYIALPTLASSGNGRNTRSTNPIIIIIDRMPPSPEGWP